NEPNKSYISSLDRITELMENLALLSTSISLDYKELRDRLESATSVAKQQVDVQAKAAETSRTDLEGEHKKHEEERQSLQRRVYHRTTDTNKKTTEIANWQARSKQQQDDYGREKETLTAIIREQRDKLERQETVLDHPDGYITYVDFEAREVQVNINR